MAAGWMSHLFTWAAALIWGKYQKVVFFFLLLLLIILFYPTGWKYSALSFTNCYFLCFLWALKHVCSGSWLLLAACIHWIYSDLGWLLCVVCWVHNNEQHLLPSLLWGFFLDSCWFFHVSSIPMVTTVRSSCSNTQCEAKVLSAFTPGKLAN